MQDTATVVNLEERRPFVKADVDKGYDRFAHDLTDALTASDMSARELRICLAVARKTYRYHKRVDWISNIQLSDITGIPSNHIATIKRELIERNILLVEGRSLGINPVVSEWQEKPKTPKSGSIKNSTKRESRLPKSGVDTPQNGSNNSTKRDTQKKTTNTKETNTKETRAISRLDIPKELPRDSIELFIADRKVRKQTMTDTAIKLFITKCLTAHTEGFDVAKLIDQAIESGWKTIYPKPQFKSQSKISHTGFKDKDYGETTANFDEAF